jgi:hypothetical protein
MQEVGSRPERENPAAKENESHNQVKHFYIGVN